MASLFLASDYSLESQRSGAALSAQDDLSCPRLSPTPPLPCSVSVLARFAPRHCAYSLPESIPSKLYEATQLLALPSGGRRCIRALGQGGSELWTDGKAARGLPLVFMLLFSADPLQAPHPFGTPLQARKQVELQLKVLRCQEAHCAALRALLAALW